MAKKSLIVISTFCIIALLSMPIFAAEGNVNALDNIKNGVENMANDAGRAMEGAKNGVENMANDTGRAMEGAKNGVENMMNDIGNGAKNVGDATKNTVGNMARSATNAGYTATRTSATDTTNNGFSTAMVWVILGVAGALIVGLVWYYGMQTTKRDID